VKLERKEGRKEGKRRQERTEVDGKTEYFIQWSGGL
jgi:hypothetical protein